MTETRSQTTRTTCPYCGVGCGILATLGQAGLSLRGDPDHPANRGRLCSKGAVLGETVGLEDRLLSPLMNGRAASWDIALDEVARRFTQTIAEHGPDSVAFYVSGQLLTEDYYVANKLMKGFIGSANIDTNSRLCMSSTVAGHRRAFGTDTVPGLYEDIELADLVVITGSNMAWCHPVLYQRLAAAKEARPEMRVVVIDPRRTATSEIADLHLALANGSDVALFNGLLAEIARRGATDPDYLEAHVTGSDAAIASARSTDLAATGLDETDLAQFFDLWIGTEKVVTLFSQGVNQSSSGADKVNAILNCHLATKRIGRPGMGPFSLTGQPNAMGGREVGGLANMLACHLDLENPAHTSAVQSFWQSPTIATRPGLKAVDLFRAVGDGRVRALWIMATNPVVSMPEADAVRAAIAACDFVVVSDITAATDTARLGHVVLPALGWGEKSGTVTNSERCISRQRAILPVPGEARADWRIICDVAARMGWAEAFDFESEAAVFREHAALSGVASRLGSDFDISALADISDAEYEVLAPTRWPVGMGRDRFFADGGFFTPDGKGRMLPLLHREPKARQDAHRPFRLNTGRVRDHWHTMTRTGKSPRLSQHIAEPFVEIHPEDARRLAVRPAEIVELRQDDSRALLRVLVTDRVRPGEIFAPIHWTAETSSAGRVGALIAAITDPVSGQPETKAATVSGRRFRAGFYGFAVSCHPIVPRSEYWARARIAGGWQCELAGMINPDDVVAYARDLFSLSNVEVATVTDAARGTARIALIGDGVLRAALYLAPDPVAVSRSHVAGTLGQPASLDLLSGRPAGGRADEGATICACFGVGVNTILAAIAENGLTSVEEVGVHLKAGTNCGSCRPELRRLIARASIREAAE